MTETDPLKQLAQLEGYNTIRSDHVRQMQLLRYWAERSEEHTSELQSH